MGAYENPTAAIDRQSGAYITNMIGNIANIGNTIFKEAKGRQDKIEQENRVILGAAANDYASFMAAGGKVKAQNPAIEYPDLIRNVEEFADLQKALKSTDLKTVAAANIKRQKLLSAPQELLNTVTDVVTLTNGVQAASMNGLGLENGISKDADPDSSRAFNIIGNIGGYSGSTRVYEDKATGEQIFEVTNNSSDPLKQFTNGAKTITYPYSKIKKLVDSKSNLVQIVPGYSSDGTFKDVSDLINAKAPMNLDLASVKKQDSGPQAEYDLNGKLVKTVNKYTNYYKTDTEKLLQDADVSVAINAKFGGLSHGANVVGFSTWLYNVAGVGKSSADNARLLSSDDPTGKSVEPFKKAFADYFVKQLPKAYAEKDPSGKIITRSETEETKVIKPTKVASGKEITPDKAISIQEKKNANNEYLIGQPSQAPIRFYGSTDYYVQAKKGVWYKSDKDGLYDPKSKTFKTTQVRNIIGGGIK